MSTKAAALKLTIVAVSYDAGLSWTATSAEFSAYRGTSNKSKNEAIAMLLRLLSDHFMEGF